MKTSKIVATLLCLAFLMCSLCGCSPKTAITGEEFTEKMEAEGFVIEDLTYALDSDALAKLALVPQTETFRSIFTI